MATIDQCRAARDGVRERFVAAGFVVRTVSVVNVNWPEGGTPEWGLRVDIGGESVPIQVRMVSGEIVAQEKSA